MTAEEVALEEFRLLAKCARDEMRLAKMMRAERDSDARWFFAMAREYRVQMKSLARIIRAIRAERTPFHAMEKRLAGSIEGGIEAGIALIKARAYAQGRRDALRGVQGACLFEMGRLEERQRKYGGASWDWEGYPEDMRAYDVLCEVAEFAEEAAR